jgi:chitinase
MYTKLEGKMKKSIEMFGFCLGVILLIATAATLSSAQTAGELTCAEMIQGKVAWNQAGNKSWNPANIKQLCKGTTSPGITVACFQRQIATHNDWGRAIEFCKTEQAPAPKPEPTPTRVFPETYTRIPTERSKRFDEYTWLTAHNAFVNYEDARWTAPNQSYGIIKQLDNGVRGLMLDVYNFSGSNFGTCVVSFTSDCVDPGIYLCHTGCNALVGATYALPRQNLKDVLNQIGDWLGQHKGSENVITIFFEDYTSPGTLADVITSSRAAKYIFNPAGTWNVERQGWPTVASMVVNETRLLLYTSKAANADTRIGLAFDQNYNVENYWSIGDTGSNYECKTRWDSMPLNKKSTGFNRLFVMNHFRNTPVSFTAAFDNKVSNLQDRLEKCRTAAGRLPNYVALDFIELGSGKAFVDELNTRARYYP